MCQLENRLKYPYKQQALPPWALCARLTFNRNQRSQQTHKLKRALSKTFTWSNRHLSSVCRMKGQTWLIQFWRESRMRRKKSRTSFKSSPKRQIKSKVRSNRPSSSKLRNLVKLLNKPLQTVPFLLVRVWNKQGVYFIRKFLLTRSKPQMEKKKEKVWIPRSTVKVVVSSRNR